MTDESSHAATAGPSTPFAFSRQNTAPGLSPPCRNRVVAFDASGSGVARTTATPETTQFQANAELSFTLPPEMCRRSYYTEIEGGHLETSAAVVLTAQEAQVLGYHHATNTSKGQVRSDTNDASRQTLPSGFSKTASAVGLLANPLTVSTPGAVGRGGRTLSSRPLDAPSIRHPHPPPNTTNNGSRRQVLWASFNPLTAIQSYGSDSDYLASDASHPASPATPVELISPASSAPNSPGNDATKVERHYEAGRAPPTPEEDGVQVKMTRHARPGDDAAQHSLTTTFSAEIGFAHHAAPPQSKPPEISPQTPSLLSLANLPSADTLMPTPRRPLNHRALPTTSQSSSPAPKGWNERIFRSSSAPPVQRVDFASAADTPDPADDVAPSRPKSCDGYSYQQELFSSMVPKLGIRFGWSARSLDGLAPAYVSQPGLETNCTNEDIHCLVPAVDCLCLQSPAFGKNERLPCQIDSGRLVLPQASSAHASFDTLIRTSKPGGKVLAHWEQQKSEEDESEQLDNSAASVQLNEAPAASTSVEQINFQNIDPQDSDVDMGADEDGPASGLPDPPYLSARSSPVGQVSSIGQASGGLALAPIVKPKAQSRTRQLIQVQTYSAAILGGAAMLAETRTRQQARVHTPDSAILSPTNNDEVSNQAISSSAAGDQAPEAPDVPDNKRPGKKRTAKPLDLAPDASAVPRSSKRSRGDAPSRWGPEEDTILKAHFIDGVVNAPKAEDCLKDMVKAGYTRSVAAIMTRARDKIKKGLI